MLRPPPRRSFYVFVSRTNDEGGCWYWEIRRKRKPMGVRFWEGGFRSGRAAELAGKQALEDFLNRLTTESGSKSRL
jgi:hypothetical protein